MAISYTIDSSNYTTAQTFNCMKNDSVNIAGTKVSALKGYGLSEDSSLPGCSPYAVLGDLCRLEGTASTRGTYYLTQQKVSSGKYTTGATITVNVKETWYQKIFFDANGGSGAPSTQSWSTTDVSQPAASARTISTTMPTLTNYLFKGWAKSASASTAEYFSGASITLSWSTSSSAGTKFFAVWWGNWYSILKYDANGGTGAPATQSTNVTQYNQPSYYTHTISSTIPTKSGKEFLGWSFDQSATTPTYQPGGNVAVPYRIGPDGGSILYAVWGDPPSKTTMKVNDGGTWKDAQVFVNQDGTWGQPAKVYGNKDGTWKEGA